MAKTCLQCKAELPDEAGFCWRCGVPQARVLPGNRWPPAGRPSPDAGEPDTGAPSPRLMGDPSIARQPFEPVLLLVPAGEFLMGSASLKDEAADDWEQPQHSVYLPDYYIGKYPVTNAQYEVFVRATGYEQPWHWEGRRPPRSKEDHPVVNVTWRDVRIYCRWLSKVTGKSYRLASEAEWEKAARGTDGRLYPWGDEFDPGRCNCMESGIGDTLPAGMYSPESDSPYGCADMAGNVSEWTAGVWGEERNAPTFRYPYDPADGRENLEARYSTLRVVRGGSFCDAARRVRCAAREGCWPLSWDGSVGFRLVVFPNR